METETFKLFGAATLLLPAIFYVGCGRLLVVPPHSRITAVIVAIALTIGVWGYFAEDFSPLLIAILVVPAYQYMIFRGLHAVFVLRFRRSPQTAVFNFASGILPDRLFNVVLMLLSVLLPLFSVAYAFRP